MRTHATSCIGETGLKIFNGFLIFFNGFPIFLNGFPKIINSFLLSKKSEKIYLRQEVYKRSLFELCIFCHLLSHSRSKLRNTRYNTQHEPACCGGIQSVEVLQIKTEPGDWSRRVVPMCGCQICCYKSQPHRSVMGCHCQ